MNPLLKRVIGLQEDDKSDDDKLPQAVVVYLSPSEIGDEEGAHCGGCIFFNVKSSECLLTTPAKCNAEHGVCALFIGQPGKETEIKKPPFGLISKESAGYIEDGPTRCSVCEYWQGKKKEDPDAPVDEEATCEKVAGKIQAGGCCNAWEEC